MAIEDMVGVRKRRKEGWMVVDEEEGVVSLYRRRKIV